MSWSADLKTLSLTAWQKLCQILDPKEWRRLAGALNYSVEDIKHFELRYQAPSGNNSPTDELLDDWSQKMPSLEEVYKTLVGLKLIAAADVIKQHVERSANSSTHEQPFVPDPGSVGQASLLPDITSHPGMEASSRFKNDHRIPESNLLMTQEQEIDAFLASETVVKEPYSRSDCQHPTKPAQDHGNLNEQGAFYDPQQTVLTQPDQQHAHALPAIQQRQLHHPDRYGEVEWGVFPRTAIPQGSIYPSYTIQPPPSYQSSAHVSFGSPKFAQQQYAQPQYASPHYARPQYASPQYAVPQNASPKYAPYVRPNMSLRKQLHISNQPLQHYTQPGDLNLSMNNISIPGESQQMYMYQLSPGHAQQHTYLQASGFQTKGKSPQEHEMESMGYYTLRGAEDN